MTKPITDPKVLEHIKRIENALFNTYDLGDVVRYLEEKTYLKGDRFSFKDHEFQKDILSDTSSVVYVQKCAQVGMSEAMARYALAVSRIMPYFSVIMTMPFSNDAENFAKTRLDPIINDSPDLRENMDRELNNTGVKGIVNSLLYMRGCSGTTAALSVPADMLIHDEVDRSDPDVLGQYQSRIKHSKWKLTRRFGTPTTEGKGIALEMRSARRMRHAVICNCCGETFVPSYHTNVVIPGYNDQADPKERGSLKNINKYNIGSLRWQEAFLECPFCKEEPSLQVEHRKWICENPQDDFVAVGYYVTPFSVPNIVTIPSLVLESTKYKTWTEFVNQALGETADESDQQMTANDVEQCKWQNGDLNSTSIHNMGIDVGQICHIAVGRITPEDELLVVHKEQVVLALLKQRKAELAAKYRVLITVMDSFPETHLVHEMQKRDKNLFGGIYHKDRKMATYSIAMVDKDLKEGKLPVNQARIVKDLAMDELMMRFKNGRLRWMQNGNQQDEIFAAHCTDMKRVQKFNTDQEMVYVWEKSKEAQDHYWHALGYLHTACNLVPAASKKLGLGTTRIVHRLKVREKVDTGTPLRRLVRYNS